MPVCGCPAEHPINPKVTETCDGDSHYVNHYTAFHLPIWQLIRRCHRKCPVRKATLKNSTGAYDMICHPFFYLPLCSEHLNNNNNNNNNNNSNNNNQQQQRRRPQPELIDLTSDTEEKERITNKHTHVEPDRNVTQNKFTGLNVTIKKEEPDEAYGGAAVTESDATMMLAGGSTSDARPEHGQANQLQKPKQEAGTESCVHAATQTDSFNQPHNTQDTSSSKSNTSSPQKLSKAKPYPRPSTRRRPLELVAPSLARLQAMHHRHRKRRYRRRRRSNVVSSNNFLITDYTENRSDVIRTDLGVTNGDFFITDHVSSADVIRTGPGVTNGAIHGPNSNTTNTQTGSNNTSSPNDEHSNINQNGPSKTIQEETINTQGGLNNDGSTTSDSFSIKQNGPSKPSKEGTTNTQGSSNNAGSTTASISSVKQNGPSNPGTENCYPSGEKLQPVAVVNSSGKRMNALIPMEIPRDGSCPCTPKSLPSGERGSLYPVSHQIENDHNYSCSTVTTNDSYPTNTVTTSGGHPSAAVTKSGSQPNVTASTNVNHQTATFTTNDSHPRSGISRNDINPNTTDMRIGEDAGAAITRNNSGPTSTVTKNDSGQSAIVTRNDSGPSVITTDDSSNQSILININHSAPTTISTKNINGSNANITQNENAKNGIVAVNGSGQRATVTGNSNFRSTSINSTDNFPVTYFIGRFAGSRIRGLNRENNVTGTQQSATTTGNTRNENFPVTYFIGKVGRLMPRRSRHHNRGDNLTGDQESENSDNAEPPIRYLFTEPDDSSEQRSITSSFEHVAKLHSRDRRRTRIIGTGTVAIGTLPFRLNTLRTGVFATNSAVCSNIGTNINSRHENVTSTTTCKNGNYSAVPKCDSGPSSTNCRSANVANASTPNICNNISSGNSKDSKVASINSSYGIGNSTISASSSVTNSNSSTCINSRSECVTSTTVSENAICTVMPRSDGGLSSTNCTSASVTNANKPNICNNTSSDNTKCSNYAPTYSSHRKVSSTIGNIIVSPKEDSSKHESFSDGCSTATSTATSTVSSNNRNDTNTNNISGNVINVKTANRNNEHPNGDQSVTDSELSVQKSLIHNSAGSDNCKGKNDDNRTNCATSSYNVDESNTDGNEGDKMSSDDHYSDSTATKKLRFPGTIRNSDTNECDTSAGVSVCGTDEESDDDNDEEEYCDDDNNDRNDDDYDGDDDDDDDDDEDEDEDDDNGDGDTDDGSDDDNDDEEDDDDDEGESNVHRNKDSLIEGDTESDGDCGNNDMPNSSGSFAESNDTSEAGDCTSTDVCGTHASARDSCNDSDVSSYSHGNNKRSNMSVEDNNAKRLKLEPAANIDFERIQGKSSENNCIANITED